MGRLRLWTDWGHWEAERVVADNGMVRAADPGWRTRLARRAAGVRSDIAFAATDALLVVFAYSAALLLRFIDLSSVPPNWWRSFLVFIPIIVAVHISANLTFGAYGHVWEFASVEEALRLVWSAIASSALLIGGTMVYRDLADNSGPLPFTVLAVGSGIALGGMGVIRFRSRLFSFRRTSTGVAPLRTLVVGTGRAAADLARNGGSQQRPLRVVGFVAAEEVPSRRRLAGRQVLGTVRDLADLVELDNIDQVVVVASLGEEVIKEVLDQLIDVNVGLRLLPDLNGAANRNGIQDPRDISITDLLPRPTVKPDFESVRSVLEGRRVIVTGAGGSIGSEIVNQLLRHGVVEVIALDHDETHLHDAGMDWGDDPRVVPVLADICDAARMRRVFEAHRPNVIFHAAAHKHVPILETNAEEAVKTNVLGTRGLLEAARRSSDVERVVLISTDKAVRPSSVMGASKRVAEMLVQSAAATDRSRVYTSVRFGNVMGSRGSVIPTFTRQIRMGGPVTVSDAEMTRYFMTTSEAVELVLQASARATGGEVFVLDMGEPVKILELARRMIRLAGLVPGRDVEIVYTGVRPGEKIHEVLSHDGLDPSDHPKIHIAKAPNPGPVTLFAAIKALESLVELGDAESMKRTLLELALQRWRGSEVLDLTLFDASEVAQSS